MNREESLLYINSHPEMYLKPAKKAGTYICPLCNNGTGRDGDGMSVDPNGNGKHLKCFKCGFYGDMVELIAADNGLDNGGSAEALELARIIYNLTVDAEPEAIMRDLQKPPTKENKRNFSQYITAANTNLKNSQDGISFLQARGIALETAERFMLGYDDGKIVIPYDAECTYYTTREIFQKRYYKPSREEAGEEPIFNRAALRSNSVDVVFVVESALCAISIMQAGGSAIALNGTGYRKFVDELGKVAASKTFVLSLDNDDAGKAAQKQLSAELQKRGISFLEANIAGASKDPNERLQTDPEGFTRAVERTILAATNPDSTEAYLLNFIQKDIAAFKADSTRKTGFANLDNENAAGGLYTGLYVIGALSSLGKTTFALQLADQLAASGESVIFFSLEQSRLELVCKSVSRTMAQKDAKTAQTALQLRKGNWTPEAQTAAAAYLKAVESRVSIVEGNFSLNVQTIRNYITKFKVQNGGKSPVVILDYLQVLQQTDSEKRQGIRDAVEANVTELKKISRDLAVPLIVISSINRSNYLAPIDFTSFKESGLIEFTADVVWGLQYACIANDPVFELAEQTQIKKKREALKKAKAENPRKIQLVCLKNRFGKDFTAEFYYYPQHDRFIEK